MSNLILFIIYVLLTETITEILSKSSLFLPVRKWFFDRRSKPLYEFIHALLDCPFCTSVWVGTFISITLVSTHIFSPWLDWFIIGLILHKSANVTHNLIDRTRRS
jgi:hypothetical protein